MSGTIFDVALVRYLLRQVSRRDLSSCVAATYNQTHTVGHLTRVAVTLEFVVTDKVMVAASTLTDDDAPPPEPVAAPAAVAAVPAAPRAYDLADQPVLQEEPTP